MLCLTSRLLALAPLIAAQSSLQLSGRFNEPGAIGLVGALVTLGATQRFGTVEDLA
jgi:hypothetical protein